MLNKNTRLYKYPIPSIDDLLDRLASTIVYSKIDLTNAYYQVPIAEGHQYKTAFQAQFSLYEWVVLLLGLCNALDTFQRLLHNVFDSALDGFINVYLDDILIFSKNEEEHMQYLRFALEILRAHNLKAKSKKSGLSLYTVEYLGHVIEAITIKADPSKVSAVMDWPVLQDVKYLQSFLGLANYYNRFIRRFSYIADPLTQLLAKNVPFVWGELQQAAFDEVKLKLTTTPILQLPKFDYDYILQTDASAFSTGGALMQDKGQGLQPVSFFSKKLSDAEKRYSQHKVELLAILQAFEKFRPQIKFRHTTV